VSPLARARQLAKIAAFLSPVACGGSTDDIRGAARTMTMIEAMCSPAGADAGNCVPSRVHGLARSARCLVQSDLQERGVPIPDGGGSCPPP